MRAPLLFPIAALLLATSGYAAAAPVAVTNPGFEDLYLGSNLPAEYGGDVPAGAFPVGPPPTGWSAWYEFGAAPPGAFIGVLNPGTAAEYAPAPAFFTDGAPEGDNAVLLYADGDTGGDEYGVEQTLAVGFEPDTTYTLTVQVGNIGSATGLVEPFLGLGFYDLDGFPGYRIQLLSDGAVVAEDTGSVLPPEREFRPAALVFTTGDAPPTGAIGIRLVNRNEPDVSGVRGLEVDFDDVSLDASPAVNPVPIAPLVGLLLGASLLATGLVATGRRIPGA
jgi:hypothetical protein